MPAALLITFGMAAARLMPQYPVCVVLSATISSHHRVGKQAKSACCAHSKIDQMLSMVFVSLGQDSVERRHISSAQLETVVYACMRFQHQLPSGAAACPRGLLLACLIWFTLSAHHRLRNCLASLEFNLTVCCHRHLSMAWTALSCWQHPSMLKSGCQVSRVQYLCPYHICTAHSVT